MRTSSAYKRITKMIHKYYNDEEDEDVTKPFLIETHMKNLEVDYVTIDYVEFGIFFNGNNDFVAVIKIEIPQAYPFRPPNVLINGHNYKRLLALPQVWTDFFDIDTCLCCNSILCKWGPSYNIRDVLTEVIKNMQYKIRINEIKVCRQLIKQKMNINYLPIEEFL